MNSVEFKTTTHDGIIDLPKQLLAWNGKQVKVILLEDFQEKDKSDSPDLSLFKQYKGKFKGDFNRDDCYER